ncbi:hypothetical protein ACFJIV_11660 [Mucilaginibacter sp. UC70_90]
MMLLLPGGHYGTRESMSIQTPRWFYPPTLDHISLDLLTGSEYNLIKDKKML